MLTKALQATLIGLLALGCDAPEDGVVVFAAASLRVAIEEATERWNGDARISAAGSQVLRRQIEAGAPADVFVPASFGHVRGEGIEQLIEEPSLLACNSLVLVVSPESSIRTFEQLPEAARIVLGTPEVPVGEYADQLLLAAGGRFGGGWRQRVLSRVVSREIDVRQVLAKVTLGEADAAIVYRTDARLANVREIEPPEGLEMSARYPIALVRDAPPEAADLVRWLRSDRGASLLSEHGFTRCPVGETPAP